MYNIVQLYSYVIKALFHNLSSGILGTASEDWRYKVSMRPGRSFMPAMQTIGGPRAPRQTGQDEPW